MSSNTLESLYQAAKYLYEHQQYSEAAAAFSVLTFIHAKNASFWLALGHSEYHCANYEPALIAYATACIENPFDHTCHLYSCRCYEAINEIDNALNALELALFVIGDNSEYKTLKAEIVAEQERLNTKNRAKNNEY